MTLSTGSVVAGYRVESLLGSGAMGAVYSAEETALGRRVALKILAPSLARDDRFRDRFLRESQIAAGLEHPNVIPIYAAGEAEGELYLAMRYVDGRDLAALLRILGRLDPDRVLSIATQVGGALDAAHAQGLVHRDVKPGNILLTRHGAAEHAYLCDFGLAKHASTVSSLTGEHAVVGTVDYLAPEQIEGRPVDGRVDVYGLGCVVYECLTGKPPFDRGNELAALLAHINDPIPAPSERVAELPEALDGVIRQALAKDRDERFASAGELVAAVRSALAGAVPAETARAAARTAAVRTFLFADVRGYTAYTRESGDEAGAALAAQFAAIVRALAPDYDGHLQELRGDEALVVFDSARQALRFAVALQNRVSSDELPRPIGIGLDAGEAVPVEDGFRGGALNRAARLCALAKPGEVLATDAVVELAGKAEGVAHGFRRVERLKGFERPVGVVEIHPPEGAPGRDLGRRVKRTALGSRPRLRLLVLGVLVAGAAAVGLFSVIGGSAAPPANSVVGLDVADGKVTGSVDADGEFHQIVSGEGVLYGMDLDAGLIARIDPETGAIIDRAASAASRPSQVAPATAYGSIWAADSNEPAILRIDPRTPASPIRIALPNPTATADPQSAQGVAVTKHGIWAAYGTPQRIARIDPTTNRVLLSRKLEGASFFAGSLLASDGDVLWAVQRDAHNVWRLDPRSGDTLATGKIGNDTVEDAALEAGYLWVALETAGGVWKLDQRATNIGKIETGALPWAVVPGGGELWVPNANDGTVTRIDPETDKTTTFEVGHRPLGTAVANDRVWVSLGLSAADAQSRISGSRVLRAAVIGDAIPSTDPAETTTVDQMAVAHATGARLMEYGVEPDGSARIVPELAAGLPAVSKDGLTYTFTVRKGFGFSPPSTDEVTPESLRHAIERVREQDSDCAYVFDVIKSIEVRADEITFTLNSASGDFSARMAHPCASAVPVDTPVVPGGVTRPFPSAGPYYPDSHVFGQQIVLLRNPNYGGERPHELDAIVLGLGYASDDAAQAVARGDADLVTANMPATGALAPDGTLAKTHGPAAGARQRYFRSATTQTRTVILNVVRGPLADARLRQAVSLALDRGALAPVMNGVPHATMIPSGVPGWVGSSARARPAPARARALVGGRSISLSLIHFSDFPELATIAELVRRDLGRVGIDVQIREHPEVLTLAGDPAAGVDMVLLGWAMDFADPASALTDQLLFFWNELWKAPDDEPEPAWLRAAVTAQRVTGPGRASTFGALDERLSRVEIPSATFSSVLGRPVFFSERVGCQRFLPLYDGLPDLGALCLRDEDGSEPS